MKHLTDSQIQDYLDGNLTAEQEKQLQHHAGRCIYCRRELETYKELYLELRRQPAFSISPSLADHIIEKIQSPEKPTSSRGFWDFFILVMGILSSLGVLFYFISFDAFLKSFHFLPQINWHGVRDAATVLLDYMRILPAHTPVILSSLFILLIFIFLDRFLLPERQ